MPLQSQPRSVAGEQQTETVCKGLAIKPSRSAAASGTHLDSPEPQKLDQDPTGDEAGHAGPWPHSMEQIVLSALAAPAADASAAEHAAQGVPPHLPVHLPAGRSYPRGTVARLTVKAGPDLVCAHSVAASVPAPAVDSWPRALTLLLTIRYSAQMRVQWRQVQSSRRSWQSTSCCQKSSRRFRKSRGH
jgi:hypothetical protein